MLINTILVLYQFYSMNSNLSITNLLRRLWGQISPRRRWQFTLLLALMLLASFSEILSIGAVLPFLGALTAPDRIFEMPVIQPLIQALGLTASTRATEPALAWINSSAKPSGNCTQLRP